MRRFRPELCSGDMLLEALIACAGVSMRAAAAVLGIPLRSVSVRAEGDVDLRGTLGIAADVPVGFKEIRLSFDVDADVDTASARSARRAHRQILRGIPDHPEHAEKPASRSSAQNTDHARSPASSRGSATGERA